MTRLYGSSTRIAPWEVTVTVKMKKIGKTPFVLLALLLCCAAVTTCRGNNPAASHKTLVLGIDGMDHAILSRLMKEGKMPNFTHLANQGGFRPLISAIPAQSPVAWSNFITGMNPGGHGIFDFIHRKPEEGIVPYLSTSEAEEPKPFKFFGREIEPVIKVGECRIPLRSGSVRLNRHGDAFWQILGRHGVPTIIFKIPSNFPPVECERCETLSGMGTPDILGTYGTFSYYTDNPPDNASDVSGGNVYSVWVEDNVARDRLVGPPNTFKEGAPATEAPFQLFVDPKADVAKLEIGDEEALLKVGEWSDWIRVEFDVGCMMPSISGIVKFYLEEVRPDLKLYASPINLDPAEPAMPISIPDSYSKDVAFRSGLFYTQGMAEDTKALQYNILDDDRYVEQASLVFEERKRLFWSEFDNWKKGLMFFYFSSLDQNGHVMWRAFDRQSKAYNDELNRKYGHFLDSLYIGMDKLLGDVMAKLDDETTLIVMSDHGFTDYHRMFNLNTWLLDNGYMYLNDPAGREKVEFLSGVDWSRTKAYNIGINALYINMRGREADGIVEPGEEADRLIEEIALKLEAVVDEQTGKRPVKRAFITKKVFSGPYVDQAPDIIVGYDRGYRTSDDSALGKIPENWFDDNTGTWSGDHCMDPEVVPGILLANRKIKFDGPPRLYDLTPTILKEYGIPEPDYMVGKPVW